MNSYRHVAAIAGLSCAIAGFSPVAGAGPMELAQAPDAPRPVPASPPEADKSRSRGLGWYLGTGIGPGFGAKYKLNGQSITFSDRLQGATDKSPLIGLNIVNAGIALSPSLLVGFSGSAVAQSGKLAGKDAHLQINNYFAALTWFPAEQGFFLRGGGGLSGILIDTGTSKDRASGFGIVVGAGYALRVAGGHSITVTVDHSRQSYSGSTTKPDNSQFTAAYLGYMYRH